MEYPVLGVGYSQTIYAVEKEKWVRYGIIFDFVDDVAQAAKKLIWREYVCVVICSDNIPDSDLFSLRKIRPIPILVVPPSYSADQRFTCVHFSAMQYIHTAGLLPASANLDAESSLRYYLDIPTGERKPLTIITVKDLCFCLEHRSVEISGKEIELTEKEFDILTLLIMNQRQVFTPDMIMDAVWREDYGFYSKGAVSTHISNLRRKLKVSPDMPDYIQTVYGIGYKFDVPQQNL